MIVMETLINISKVFEFPLELREAIKGLNNEFRQKILIALYSRSKLSFSDLVNITNIKRNLLPNHLNILVRSFLVDHFYEHNIGDSRYSYYKITKVDDTN